MKVKHLEVDPELHKKLKTRASDKGKYLKDEVKEILMRELDIVERNTFDPKELNELVDKELEVDDSNE